MTQHNSSGRKPRVSDRELLDVFSQHSDPVLSTAEVAQYVPIKRRGVLRRLRKLEQQGELSSKAIGGRNTVWWIRSLETDENSSQNDSERHAGTQGHNRETDVRESDRAITTHIELVAVETLPGSGSKLARRKEALQATVEYLKANVTVTPREFQEEVYPEHKAGYATAQSWWKNCIYKGLRELSDRCSEIERADTTGEWTYNDTERDR